MRDPARILPVLAGFLLLARAGLGISAVDRPAEPPTYEVWYTLDAEVRTLGARADIRAGGRLLMRLAPGPAGDARLELVRALEDPWKLYRVDPLGPFSQEVKLATVKTLPEASWAALETAQSEIGETGRHRHAQWLDGADRKRPLDGAFGFIVIGPARDRFAIDFHPSGRVRQVTNRLTDRWLSGPFDRFADAPPEEIPHGYWFWNDGESEPPGWEPHTYHAFAKALELLALPLPTPEPDSGQEPPTVTWTRLGHRALEVLTTLAPRIGARIDAGASRPGDLELTGRIDGSSVTLKLDLPDDGLQIERQTSFSSPSPATRSDRLRLRIENRKSSLEIEVGYRER